MQSRRPHLPVTFNLIVLIQSCLNLADPDSAMRWAAFSTDWLSFLCVSEPTIPPSGFDISVRLSISDFAVDCHLWTSGMLLLNKASKTDPFCQSVKLFLP